MAVRIAEVHCAQDARGRAQGRAHVALLDVHVVGVGQHPHAGGPDRRDQLRRLRDGVDHVVLVAVERLEEQHDTSRRRMAADLGEALQQDLPVPRVCAAGPRTAEAGG
jgi:predicted metal-dependent TIM-barrel fold hydrolase